MEAVPCLTEQCVESGETLRSILKRQGRPPSNSGLSPAERAVRFDFRAPRRVRLRLRTVGRCLKWRLFVNHLSAGSGGPWALKANSCARGQRRPPVMIEITINRLAQGIFVRSTGFSRGGCRKAGELRFESATAVRMNGFPPKRGTPNETRRGGSEWPSSPVRSALQHCIQGRLPPGL
jgi:hypothetical protein